MPILIMSKTWIYFYVELPESEKYSYQIHVSNNMQNSGISFYFKKYNKGNYPNFLDNFFPIS